MPVERQRLIFFAYFCSPSYAEFLLLARDNVLTCGLCPDSVVKVWEDGFLQFAASKCGSSTQDTPPPMPVVVDANTGEQQQFLTLDQLSPSQFLTLFAQLMRSGKVWRLQNRKNGECGDWSNPYIELLTMRLKMGRWKVTEKYPEIKRLIEAGTNDLSVTTAVCFAHELWGTHLLRPRLAVRVDTILGGGLTVETKKKSIESRKR